MTLVVASFFSGNYVACCEQAPLESSSAMVRSVWFRSCVHLGRVAEAKSLAKGPGALDAALLLFLEGFPHRDAVEFNWDGLLERAEEAGTREGDRDEAAVILSIVYGWAGRLEVAYRLAAQSTAVEGQLLLVSYQAKVGRFDLAGGKLERLKAAHVDEIAYQLVEAEVAMRRGGMHAKEAVYIYQELVQVYGRTAKLLNGQAAACLLANRLSDAEMLILEVLEQVRWRCVSRCVILESPRYDRP